MADDRLGDLVRGLYDLVDASVEEANLTSFNPHRLLRFVTKVVQLMEQAFQDVLAVMIEFKYISQADKQSGKLKQLAKELDLLLTSPGYRHAEELQSRLHLLREYYQSEIRPLTESLTSHDEWQSIMWTLIGHESYIYFHVWETIWGFQQLIDNGNIRQIKASATDQVNELRALLSQVHALSNQLLGLSGTIGLLELTKDDISDKRVDLKIKVGDTYNISGQAGAVGANAQAHDLDLLQIHNQIAQSIDLSELVGELATLRQAMKKQAVEPEQDISVGEVGKAEQAAKAKDTMKVVKHLKSAGKWALEVAMAISVPVATDALKKSLGLG